MIMSDKDFSNLNALVVDDDSSMLEVCELSLQMVGVGNVTCCARAADALLNIKENPADYHFLMCDLQMPEMDGVELLRKIAALGFQGGVILFSGQDLRIIKAVENLAGEYDLMILGVLQKPFKTDDLLRLVEQYETKLLAALDGDNQKLQLKASDLSEAIECRQIMPWFQPKINMETGAIESVEALARWQHPEHGLIVPDHFISLAEKTGLIEDLTELIFKSAIKVGSIWSSKMDVAINLSADMLSDVDFPERIMEWVAESRIQPAWIILEITESKLIENFAVSLDILSRLCLKGFRLSIDDFGTGYSSMKQLLDIPFSELKVDRAFVNEAWRKPEARAIFESSVDMAKKLNLKVVAEGVETKQDWDLAKQLGCHLAQGYFIARPMPLVKLPTWIREKETAYMGL
jgi:EAL domain-containing protein (putative c-di-GMP-specific phosphodiesterase class I)